MDEKRRSEIERMTEESRRNLQSISGQDLINRVLVFDVQLRKLISEQLLPPAMVIGSLMGHVYRLQSRNMISSIGDVLRGTGGYVDKRFVTKEEFNILVKMVEAITEKLEGESFKPKIE